METQNLKTAILGVGMVGGALRRYFQKQDIEPFVYDKGRNIGSVDEINRADVVFVCVPTPFKKDGTGFDLSCVEETCNYLTGSKIVVIKSTVVPGTTEYFQKKYPQHKFLFNPEFLTEDNADEDMQKPERQIIGYTEASYSVADKIMELLPEAPFQKVVKATEAEAVKYFGNNFLAVKVIFGVQMYQLCQKLGVDYDVVRKCASADSRIGRSHLDVRHGGYFGFGGSCIPKDIRAMIQFSDKKGVDLKLLKITEQINNELMAKQGIEDPEKFSKREL